MKLQKTISSLYPTLLSVGLMGHLAACQRSAQFSSGDNKRTQTSEDINVATGAAVSTPDASGDPVTESTITDTSVTVETNKPPLPTETNEVTDTATRTSSNTSTTTATNSSTNTNTNTNTNTSTATTTNTSTTTNTTTSTTTTTTTNTSTTTNTNTEKEVTIEKTFPAANFEPQTMTFMPTYGSVRQTFPMARPQVAKTTSKQQTLRMEKQLQFKQGFYGEKISEDFSQNKLGVLDLLVILDNSTSMQDELADISKNLDPLISAVSDADWRIAFILTDPTEECIMSYVSRDDAQAANNFKKTIMSVKPSNNPRAQKEHGILQSVRGLADTEKCRMGRDTWVRPKSNVAVLIISDEDNCQGDAPGDTICEIPASNKAEYLTDYMKNDMGRTLGTDAKVYSIVWDPARATCNGGYGKGVTYKKATDLSGGKLAHICDRNFGSVFNMISKDLKVTLKNQVTLKQLPNENTLKVYVNDVLQTSGYSVAQKVITFTTLPPVGAKIRVDYETPSEPVKTAFSIDDSAAVDGNTLRVLVNGVAQAADTYSYIAAQNILEFKQAPAELATITVYFKDRNGLALEFPVAGSPIAGSVTVFVNDQLASNYTYDAANKKIVFASAPVDAAVVRIDFKEYGPAPLTYTLSANVATFLDLKAYRVGATTDAITVALDKNLVTLSADDFVDGATLVVDYRDPGTVQQKFQLGDVPYSGQFTVKTSKSTCASTDFVLSGMEITTSCVLAKDEQVTVGYVRVKERFVEFELTGVMNPEKAVWQVFVDAVETTQYVRTANKIKLGAFPKETSQVLIRAKEKVPVMP